MPFYWFCHEMAQFFWKKKTTKKLRLINNSLRGTKSRRDDQRWGTNVSQHETYLLILVPNTDSNESAHPHSLISLGCPHEKKKKKKKRKNTLYTFCPKCTQRRFWTECCECAGWSEFTLMGEHVRRYVFWLCGSNNDKTNGTYKNTDAQRRTAIEELSLDGQ